MEILRVRSAAEMHHAVMSHAAGADVVIMAAAVADYRPVTAHDQKMSKERDALSLQLVRNPDILSELSRRRGGAFRPVLVGFAAETQDIVGRAREKLRAKAVDMIVANDVSRKDAGFDTHVNTATIVSADGEEDVPLALKTALASVILDRVERRLESIPVP
jgi:phosphopantothenoylcysteine decarboxylase/phosphopantothenate--cysteine ligase